MLCSGRVIYDLNKQVYRVRELSREPLPMERLRFANTREESATRFLQENFVKVNSVNDINGVLSMEGSVRDRGRIFYSSLDIDRDERIIKAKCNCN